MPSEPSVTVLSSKIVQTFQVEFRGLQEVEENLKSKVVLTRPLTELWRLSLGLSEENDQRDPNIPNSYIWVFIEATASKYEYYDLCNIWARTLKWGAKLQCLGGSVIFCDIGDMLSSSEARTFSPSGELSLKWGWKKFIKLDTLFENRTVKADDAFEIILSLEESQIKAERFNEFKSAQLCWQTSNALACTLLDPATGDVVFEISDEEEGELFLYAHKKILMANCDYFKMRFSPEWDHSNSPPKPDNEGHPPHPELQAEISNTTSWEEHSTISTEKSGENLVDSKRLAEDLLCVADPEIRGHRNHDESNRTIIRVDDIDFTTMHNILYYLYTGCVNLHHSYDNVLGPCEEVEPDAYPNEADALQLYHAANQFLIEDLETRCYFYLSSTCTVENIIQRLFNNVKCTHHERILNMYLDYVIKNFDSIKMSKEWEEALRNMKESSPELLAHQTEMLLKITQRTVGVK